MVLFAFGALFVLPLILIGALAFVFWLIMLVDAATRKFKDSTDKIVWILVVIFVTFIGALIYYFVIYIKDKSKSIKWLWWTLLGLVLSWLLIVITSAIVFSKVVY